MLRHLEKADLLETNLRKKLLYFEQLLISKLGILQHFKTAVLWHFAICYYLQIGHLNRALQPLFLSIYSDRTNWEMIKNYFMIKNVSNGLFSSIQRIENLSPRSVF